MTKDEYPSKEEILKTIFDAVYAQYPKKEFVGLTDDEIEYACSKCDKDFSISAFKMGVIWAEQELKTKNGFSGLKDKNT